MKTIKKLDIDIPRHIVRLPNSNWYYNSHTGDRIRADKLYEYVTGNLPPLIKGNRKEITEIYIDEAASLKDEQIRNKRWDLDKD